MLAMVAQTPWSIRPPASSLTPHRGQARPYSNEKARSLYG